MKISTRGRYALRTIIDIARHDPDEYIRLKDIAERQQISEKYLESVVKFLVDNKMLEGKRGKKISSTEMKDDEFFKQKADLKLILIGDSAVGKSK